MKAKFIGDPANPGEERNLPEVTNMFGVTFPRGKFVDVPDHLAKKIEGNSHFETQGKEPAPPPAPTPVVVVNP